MDPVYLTVALAALALAGQVANLVLYLKIRVGQLETKEEVLARVSCEYRLTDVCQAQMQAMEHRVTTLEGRHATT